jgi:hypothetical protein
VAKVRAPYAAAVAIASFGATRYPRPRLGALLGLAELTLAAALILDVMRVGALAAASGLLLLFAYAIARMLQRGASFSCFCFGSGDKSISRADLVRTTALAGLAIVLLGVAPAARNSDFTQLALEATAAAAIVAVVILAGQLPDLVRMSQHRHVSASA